MSCMHYTAVLVGRLLRDQRWPGGPLPAGTGCSARGRGGGQPPDGGVPADAQQGVSGEDEARRHDEDKRGEEEREGSSYMGCISLITVMQCTAELFSRLINTRIPFP